jgi:hypothetical protein
MLMEPDEGHYEETTAQLGPVPPVQMKASTILCQTRKCLVEDVS